MKNYWLLPLVCCIVLLQSCAKEEAELRLPGFEVPVVHGFYVRNEAGIEMGWLGYAKPNVNTGINDGVGGIYNCVFFPNPSSNFATLYVQTPADQELKKIWITRAIFHDPLFPLDLATYGGVLMVAGGVPLLQGETYENNLFLDMTGFPDGYYRIYIKVGEHLFYDNVVVDRSFLHY